VKDSGEPLDWVSILEVRQGWGKGLILGSIGTYACRSAT
jgi:hypothetical protein